MGLLSWRKDYWNRLREQGLLEAMDANPLAQYGKLKCGPGHTSPWGGRIGRMVKDR